jgi:two-component system, OmpR family, alkaline phosphatase synthesis response regulator PhoP
MNAWYVDDDQEMLNAVKLLLRLLGYQMRGFLDARGAAKILQYGNLPDLLILDINMPGVSGLDLLEFVRRNPEWNGVPIVMLSTEFAPVEIERALRLGADAYVTKPVMLDELESAIQKAIEKRKNTKG